MKKSEIFKAYWNCWWSRPYGSAFLYNTIIEVCQKQYGSTDYNEFPEIVLESYPFTRGDREKIRQDISLCFAKLKSAGAELFCIASNSFHGFLPDISLIAFVNLILEVLEKEELGQSEKELREVVQKVITN